MKNRTYIWFEMIARFLFCLLIISVLSNCTNNSNNTKLAHNDKIINNDSFNLFFSQSHGCDNAEVEYIEFKYCINTKSGEVTYILPEGIVKQITLNNQNFSKIYYKLKKINLKNLTECNSYDYTISEGTGNGIGQIWLKYKDNKKDTIIYYSFDYPVCCNKGTFYEFYKLFIDSCGRKMPKPLSYQELKDLLNNGKNLINIPKPVFQLYEFNKFKILYKTSYELPNKTETEEIQDYMRKKFRYELTHELPIIR